ncbi:hypothetical protein CL630_02575 [bacterium]|nr:hypothetical protein [bacterium]|tara:strand:- start:21702 stop:22850 length:1149 start_codon:yes stop_codon:yes gene_type:complete
MRIFYISNSRIPTEKAYGVSIMKTCAAFADGGAEVTLFAPKVKNTAGDDPFSFYNVSRSFVIQYIPTFDTVTWGWRYGFLLNQLSFAIALFFSFSPKKDDVIITRDEASGFLLSFKMAHVFYDMHGFPERKLWIWKMILRRMRGIITTNEWKAKECRIRLGIPEEKIIVARNGFDPDTFSMEGEQKTLRKKLRLPIGMPIVLYTGHLYDWKGVYVLAETAALMPQVNFIFVGGTYYHCEDFEKQYKGISNIILVGHKPYTEIPAYLKAADVLVLPNSAMRGEDPRFSIYSRNDTSPIKLFEYMASRTPIVASSLPSVKEILNDKNAVLVEPDNPQDLQKGIEVILENKQLARNVSEKAWYDVQDYTWEKRAGRILKLVSKTS